MTGSFIKIMTIVNETDRKKLWQVIVENFPGDLWYKFRSVIFSNACQSGSIIALISIHQHSSIINKLKNVEKELDRIKNKNAPLPSAKDSR